MTSLIQREATREVSASFAFMTAALLLPKRPQYPDLPRGQHEWPEQIRGYLRRLHSLKEEDQAKELEKRTRIETDLKEEKVRF